MHPKISSLLSLVVFAWRYRLLNVGCFAISFDFVIEQCEDSILFHDFQGQYRISRQDICVSGGVPRSKRSWTFFFFSAVDLFSFSSRWCHWYLSKFFIAAIELSFSSSRDADQGLADNCTQLPDSRANTSFQIYIRARNSRLLCLPPYFIDWHRQKSPRF